MVSAATRARCARVAISIYSSSVCGLPPTGPTPQIVGAPALAAKPESAQPPVNSPAISRPIVLAITAGQFLALRCRNEWEEVAVANGFRAGPRYGRSCHDGIDRLYQSVTLGVGDEPHIHFAAGHWRNRVDRYAAADKADIERHAVLDIGECMQRVDLVGQLGNGAGAFSEIDTGMRRLAGNVETIAEAALAGSPHRRRDAFSLCGNQGRDRPHW